MFKQILSGHIDVDLTTYYDLIDLIEKHNKGRDMSDLVHIHHIIPKYMFKLFEFNLNADWNLLKVDIKQHYTLHETLKGCFDLSSVHYKANHHASVHLYKSINLTTEEYNKLILESIELNRDMWNRRKDELVSKMRIANSKPEVKLKRQISSKKVWEDIDFTTKMKNILKMAHNTPTAKLNHSNENKNRWCNAEYKNRLRNSIIKSHSNVVKEQKSISMKLKWTDPKFIENRAQKSGSVYIIVNENLTFFNRQDCIKHLNITNYQFNKLIKLGLVTKPYAKLYNSKLRLLSTNEIFKNTATAMKALNIGRISLRNMINDGTLKFIDTEDNE